MGSNSKQKNKPEKALIILSGGLDSTAALYMSLKNYSITCCVFFNYGQKAYKEEYKACKRLTSKLKLNLIKIDIPWPNIYSQSALTSKNIVIPELDTSDLKDKIKLKRTALQVMVYNRNMIFISIAARIAAELNCSRLITGFNREEAQTFPDNSKEFLKSINKTLNISLKPKKVKVISPTINMTKKQIVKYCLKKDYSLNTVYSCYKGERIMCGKCESCVRLRYAVESFCALKKLKIKMKE